MRGGVEIDDSRTVTMLAVRHQREADYHSQARACSRFSI